MSLSSTSRTRSRRGRRNEMFNADLPRVGGDKKNAGRTKTCSQPENPSFEGRRGAGAGPRLRPTRRAKGRGVAAVPSIGRAATVASATDATERLYDRHHRKVYGFCLYQLGNRDDAAEASQTTFMQALTALQRGVDPTFELPWLLAIARNVCRTRWDAGKRRRRIELARDPH